MGFFVFLLYATRRVNGHRRGTVVVEEANANDLVVVELPSGSIKPRRRYNFSSQWGCLRKMCSPASKEILRAEMVRLAEILYARLKHAEEKLQK